MSERTKDIAFAMLKASEPLRATVEDVLNAVGILTSWALCDTETGKSFSHEQRLEIYDEWIALARQELIKRSAQ